VEDHWLLWGAVVLWKMVCSIVGVQKGAQAGRPKDILVDEHEWQSHLPIVFYFRKERFRRHTRLSLSNRVAAYNLYLDMLHKNSSRQKAETI
jgi:hypothetical protein